MLTNYLVNAPGRTRTCNLRIRSPELYPIELRAPKLLTACTITSSCICCQNLFYLHQAHGIDNVIDVMYLTVPISADNIDSAKEQILAAAKAGAEMLELRTDYLQGLSIELLKRLIASAKETSLPIIVTCRDVAEGGANDHSGQLRIEILLEAIRAGADFVDCEYANFKQNQDRLRGALSEKPKTRLILSAHNFQGKFADIVQLYQDISQSCPEAVPKLVYQANHLNDCFEGFDLLSSRKTDMIVLCMGQAGIISRIIAKKLGSLVTFASLDNDAATAPGQLTIGQLKNLYRYDSIDADTELFGVIADPVGHSISPQVYNSCFAHANQNKLYLPLLIQNGMKGFNEFLDNVRDREKLGLKGFSVTIPHKTNTLAYLNKHGEYIEPLAAKIGAVNTLKVGCNQRISGYNTDYAGAMDALASAMGIERKQLHGVSVTVVGAGGVSRAIVAGLTGVGAKVVIYNRTVAKAEQLAEEFNCKFAPASALSNCDAEVIINCTSLGMYPETDVTPVPQEVLKQGMVVFDTVYNPIETLLLAQAKQAGAKTVSGAEMFLGQAFAQYKLFTGTEADKKIMRAAILECL